MLRRLDALEARLVALTATSSLPEAADAAWIDDSLHRSYLGYWARSTSS